MIKPTELVKYTADLNILFVEDHEELRVDTVEILTSFFNIVDSSSDGKKGLEQYIKFQEKNKKPYDIVLSDIQMPVMNGIEMTEKIYDINSEQSIIILSAYDETQYLLSLINLGIAQFIKKPIDYQELMKAFYDVAIKINKNNEVNDSIELILGENSVYNKDSKSLIVDKENIYLTKFEIIFIELLISNFGKIFSNEDIVMHYTSSQENIDAANIRKLVSKLRKKLPENSIESIYGVGYKFIPYYGS